MSDVEAQTVTEPVVEQQEQLSEIQQLARDGKFKDAGGSAVFCIVCEKKSYPAETVWFDKLPYHKNCFKCTRCEKKIEGGFNAASFEWKLYCRGCFNAAGLNRQQAQVKWTKKATTTEVSAQFAGLGGGSNQCKVCDKKCYSAEAVLFEKNYYHPDCLRCQEDGCGKLCTLAELNQFDGKIYCGACWRNGQYSKKQLEQKSNAVKNTNYSDITLKLGGGGTKCTTCEKTCYPAETVTFEGKPYHSQCLQCTECALRLTLAQANQFEGNVLCGKCWTKGGYANKQRDATKQWKPKDPSDQSYNPVIAKLGGAASNKCQTCEKTVYPAEQLQYEGRFYHPLCFKCTHCAGRIHNINDAQHNRKNPYHNRCFQELNLHRPENA